MTNTAIDITIYLHLFYNVKCNCHFYDIHISMKKPSKSFLEPISLFNLPSLVVSSLWLVINQLVRTTMYSKIYLCNAPYLPTKRYNYFILFYFIWQNITKSESLINIENNTDGRTHKKGISCRNWFGWCTIKLFKWYKKVHSKLNQISTKPSQWFKQSLKQTSFKIKYWIF